ncbi:MAG TPA: hypothetical protein VH206_11895 [Xanthobacteraceae bacterium]|jgi:hypothetical protein|nr:hypothetical protein [Xanthobacteraceae bacterium]
MTSHKFKIGQTVALVPSIARPAASGDYQIISLRPADNSEIPKYRIKSSNEAHERVVTENDLVPPAEFDGA